MNIFESFCAKFDLKYSKEIHEKLCRFAHAVDATVESKPIQEARVLLVVMNNHILYRRIVRDYFQEYCN